MRNNTLLARHAQLLHYAADTDGGSSGAPVFNDGWQLVALHHGGVESDDGWMNEGIRISAIIDWLKGELPQLPAPQQSLLMQALTASDSAAPLAASAAPESGYGNRDGFQPDFLEGASIWQPLSRRAPPRWRRCATAARAQKRGSTTSTSLC